MSASITFSQPVAMSRHPHVLHSMSCTINGRSSWGFRMECTACGTVDETPTCSSVTAEDWPARFGYEHRDCAQDRQPQGEAVRLFTPAPTQLDGQLGLGPIEPTDEALYPGMF